MTDEALKPKVPSFDPERVSCWCRGWGCFYNTAKEPPELTLCGNCIAAREKAEALTRTASVDELVENECSACKGTGCDLSYAATCDHCLGSGKRSITRENVGG